MPISPGRAALVPASTLPLVYVAGAHGALLLAAGALAVAPDLPGGFHYHPRMIAIVHLITLGWISGSILGAFYIVAPLAFGMPFGAGPADRVACAAFWAGTAGMVAGFWLGRYGLVGAAACLTLGGLALVGWRAIVGVRASRVPWGVGLHVVFAFVNLGVAGGMGATTAIARAWAMWPWSPLTMAMAHAHLAVLGWAVMMIVGVSYRLVPMFLPAAMPKGRALATSAVLLEAGTLGLAWALLTGAGRLLWVGLVVGGLGAFLLQVHRVLATRRPRPAEMAGRDWSTWQTHVALAYLPVAVLLGVWQAVSPSAVGAWAYSVTGLVGFVSQMVVGIEGRLLPLHAWYRAMTRLDGQPPPRSVHRLADTRVALAIFLAWLAAVPTLIAGFEMAAPAVTSVAAGLLCGATLLQMWQVVTMVRTAAS